ncbi:MAG: VOC family protein [Planctomycetota bacterium]
MQVNSEIAEQSAFLGVSPQFTVPDVVAAASYYCDVLGFENRGFFGKPPVFAMLGRGNVEFFFNQSPAATIPARPRAAVGYDAYIHVTELTRLVDELTRRGAKIVAGPVDRVYGIRELVVEDCHGLRLAFGEDPGRAAQHADAADRPSAGR